MKQPGFLFIMLVVLIELLPQSLCADVIWTVEDSTYIYSEPDTDGPRKFVAKRGDKLRSSSNSAKDGWVKVVMVQDSKKVGYVRLRDLRSEKRFRRGAGIQGIFSYMSQPARTFTDGETPVEISVLGGQSIYFGVFYDFESAAQWALRAFVSLRKASLTGTTRVVSSVVPTSNSALSLSQDFIGFGLVFKYTLGRWWFGGGGEVAQGTKTTLVTSTQSDQPEKPTYFIAQGSGAYVFDFGAWFLSPEGRLGIVLNSKPSIINGEILVSAGFNF